MRTIILILFLTSFTSVTVYGQIYKHKSESEIKQMTPAQRVNEFALEEVHHTYRQSDDHYMVIEKYIYLDGLKALPQIIKLINEYDPTTRKGRRGNKGERFDAAWMLLSDLDNHAVRLRNSEQGKDAIIALERAIKRMSAAGYGMPDQHDWKRHGRFESAVDTVKYSKGTTFVDDTVRDTLRLEYKVTLTDVELLEFINFMVANYPDYPSWSKRTRFKDYTKVNKAGIAVWVSTMNKPKRYYESYLEFKKTKK